MSTTFHLPPRPPIEYPDSDGEPIAENTLQFQWIMTLEGGLEALFRDRPDVFVAGDLLWYPVEGKPQIRTAPDALVVFGRPKGHRGSYKQWEEGGVAPQVVFEVFSPGNRAGEMARKFEFYEEHGVEEYYIYDPDTGDLSGWRRSADRLEPIPRMDGHVSPRLGIRFEPGAGPNQLKVIAPDGRPLATYLEVYERAEAERRRAERERRRAQAERRRARDADQRAEAERRRAEQLAARLRGLGVDPDQLPGGP